MEGPPGPPIARAANWYGRKASADPALPDAPKDQEVGALSRRKAWARLLAKVHELDVMACPRCGSRMAVLAVIVDPAQIRKIIAYDRSTVPDRRSSALSLLPVDVCVSPA